MKSVLTGFVFPLLVAVALFLGLVYFVFPTTTWLDQRAEATELEDTLAELNAEQIKLRQDIARMRTADEVERIARRDFNLVYPGEEAFALLPAPPAPVEIPTSWPFSMLYDEVLD